MSHPSFPYPWEGALEKYYQSKAPFVRRQVLDPLYDAVRCRLEPLKVIRSPALRDGRAISERLEIPSQLSPKKVIPKGPLPPLPVINRKTLSPKHVIPKQPLLPPPVVEKNTLTPKRVIPKQPLSPPPVVKKASLLNL